MNSTPLQAEVKPSEDGKAFKLMIGKHELGVSKTDVDARFHMHIINEALKLEYQRGRSDFAKQVGAVGPVFKDSQS